MAGEEEVYQTDLPRTGTVMGNKIVEILERQEREKLDTTTQELKLDGSNQVTFPDFPYKFEALNERILVAIDIFKSGYECKTCKGRKRIMYQCSCVSTDRPGYKFSTAQLDDIAEGIGVEISKEREGILCPECKGDPESVKRNETCPDCKGMGAKVILLDNSKNLPTTGVVVSMGNIAKERAPFKLGDRILFGMHSGGAIPTKAGIMFKYMDWQSAILKIEGASDMDSFDFIIQEN